MTTTAAGLIVGALFGLATALEGWSGFLWTLLFSVIGLVVAKVVKGDIDVSPYVSSTEQKIRERR